MKGAPQTERLGWWPAGPASNTNKIYVRTDAVQKYPDTK